MALKMIKDEAEVPENALYTLRDLGQHMALCQAFALSRREKKTVYMQKQDHWCWAPLIGYGQFEIQKGTPAFNEFKKGINSLNYMGMPHSSFNMGMEYDFARPSFYNRMFRAWGLDEEREFEVPFPSK